MAAAVVTLVVACATACSTKAPVSASSTVDVVVAESAWGSLAAQLSGGRVHVTSLVTNPDADPHDYEPTADDARAISTARYVIFNGAGYDEWARRIVDSNDDPAQTILDVGALVGAGAGDNPHRWYFPDDVRRVVDRIVDDFKKIDPANAATFDQRKADFEASQFARYTSALAQIRDNYARVPVGASESLFAGIAAATDLDLTTPSSFVNAISEGVDSSVDDKAIVEDQIASKAIKVFVFNPQNSTPDVAELVDSAKRRGIPVVEFTETLVPQGATFVDWQVTQLTALSDALASATSGA